MIPVFLNIAQQQVAYYKFGTGPKAVICFHGYGERGDKFSFLEKYAGAVFTFYSFDLPGHGHTKWDKQLSFTLADLEQVLRQLIQNEKLPASKFSVLGYSLGGRLSLALLEAVPGAIDRLVLLAPDGLKLNGWYWFATQTKLGNRLFRFTMKHPHWFLWFISFLNQLKLINKSVFKFVKHHIKDKEIREELYYRWTMLRKIRPDVAAIKKLIVKNEIQVSLLYGKHDRIIVTSPATRFRKNIEPFCVIKIIESGHQLLHEKHAKDICEALLS